MQYTHSRANILYYLHFGCNWDMFVVVASHGWYKQMRCKPGVAFIFCLLFSCINHVHMREGIKGLNSYHFWVKIAKIDQYIYVPMDDFYRYEYRLVDPSVFVVVGIVWFLMKFIVPDRADEEILKTKHALRTFFFNFLSSSHVFCPGARFTSRYCRCRARRSARLDLQHVWIIFYFLFVPSRYMHIAYACMCVCVVRCAHRFINLRKNKILIRRDIKPIKC